MAIDRTVAPTSQRRYVDPYQVKVFQYDTDDSDVFLSRIANSVYRIFGDDIVIAGFEEEHITFTFTDTDVFFNFDPGMLIQDITLLQFETGGSVRLENVNNLDHNGKLIVYCRYQFLNSLEDNPAYLCANYVSPSGYPIYSWDHNRDRVLFGVYSFVKDATDRIISVIRDDVDYFTIAGKKFWILGRDPNALSLKPYFGGLLEKKPTESVEFEDGFCLINDQVSPGPLRYYGTNTEGARGFHTLPSSLTELPPDFNFTQLVDTPSAYTDAANKFLRVNTYSNAIEFSDDAPGDGKFVKLREDEVIDSNKIFAKNVVILGELTTSGEPGIIERVEMSITDNFITVNDGETGAGVTLLYSGLRVDRGSLDDAILRWSEPDLRWQVGYEGSIDFGTLALLSDLQGTSDQINTSIDLIDAKHDAKHDFYLDQGTGPDFIGNEYKLSVENGNIVLTTQLPKNKLQFSHDYANPIWVKDNLNISSNMNTDPLGSVTADTFIDGTSLGMHRCSQSVSGLNDSTIYCLSTYIKKKDHPYFAIRMIKKDGNDAWQVFNLDTGQKASRFGVFFTSGIHAIHNDWFRIWISANILTGSTTPECQLILCGSTDGVGEFLGTETGVYSWGSQLEEGDIPTMYIGNE